MSTSESKINIVHFFASPYSIFTIVSRNTPGQTAECLASPGILPSAFHAPTINGTGSVLFRRHRQGLGFAQGAAAEEDPLTLRAGCRAAGTTWGSRAGEGGLHKQQQAHVRVSTGPCLRFKSPAKALRRRTGSRPSLALRGTMRELNLRPPDAIENNRT